VCHPQLPFFTNNTWDLDGNFPDGTGRATKPVLIASVLGWMHYVRTQRPYLASRRVRYLITVRTI
jgi:hypothetical protein